MKKAFVIANPQIAERYRNDGFLVSECVKSVQIAQALLLAFVLGLEPLDVGILWCDDIDFLDREWMKKIKDFSGANFFVSESAEEIYAYATF